MLSALSSSRGLSGLLVGARNSRREQLRRLAERPTMTRKSVVRWVGGWSGASCVHVRELDCGSSVHIVRNAHNQPTVSALGFTGGAVALVDIFAAPEGKCPFFHIGRVLGYPIIGQFDCTIRNRRIGITAAQISDDRVT